MNVPPETPPSMPAVPVQPPPLPQMEAQRYQGLGGWLILVAIHLVSTPIRFWTYLVHVFLPLFASGRWEAFTTPGGVYYHPLQGPLMIAELSVNTITAVFAVVLLIFFFSKKSFFPMLMIVYLASNAVLLGADLTLSHQIPPIASQHSPVGFRELAQATAWCAIWIPYMLVSKRVKATFTK